MHVSNVCVSVCFCSYGDVRKVINKHVAMLFNERNGNKNKQNISNKKVLKHLCVCVSVMTLRFVVFLFHINIMVMWMWVCVFFEYECAYVVVN